MTYPHTRRSLPKGWLLLTRHSNEVVVSEKNHSTRINNLYSLQEKDEDLVDQNESSVCRINVPKISQKPIRNSFLPHLRQTDLQAEKVVQQRAAVTEHPAIRYGNLMTWLGKVRVSSTNWSNKTVETSPEFFKTKVLKRKIVFKMQTKFSSDCIKTTK